MDLYRNSPKAFKILKALANLPFGLCDVIIILIISYWKVQMRIHASIQRDKRAIKV